MDQPARTRPKPAVLLAIASALTIVLVLVIVLVVRSRDGGGDGAVPKAVARPIATSGPAASAAPSQLGVFRGTDPQQVRDYEDWLGRDVDYVVDFPARDSWTDISAPQYMIDAWQGTPYRKVFSVALLPDDPSTTIERGATGEYDAYFRELAHRLVQAGEQNAIIRLGWEFNLPDMRWSTGDPKAFIGYWRQVVTAMRAEPGQEFAFDWNPNNGDSPVDAVNYYPGDDVVDYIGVDAYDVAYAPDTYPYPAGCDESCREQRQSQAWTSSVFGGDRGLKFWSGFAAGHGKPLTLPEWGLWQRQDGHGGGDDAGYLRRMSAFIADPKNRVAFEAYFEVDAPDGGHRLMTTFPQAGQVFRSLFGAPSAPASPS